ncbi:hypothetical protein OHA25_07280 [Nonomuraea sp. NBC_00507]
MVLGLIDYDAMDAILAQAPRTALDGRTLDSPTSDTPDMVQAQGRRRSAG